MTDVIAADLKKVMRISEFGPYQVENLVVVLPSNPLGQREACRLACEWMDRWIALKVPIAVDVETSSLDFERCHLYSVALSGEDGCNTAVSFTLCDLHTVPWDVEVPLVQRLRRILADPEVPTGYHNAPFDYAVLKKKGFDIAGAIFDTQGLAHLVQPDIPKDLGWVGHTYLDVDPWKLDHEGRKNALTNDIVELLVYNAKDALNTMKLRAPLCQEILDRGMSAELMQYQMAYSRLAARMELKGIPINHALRKQRSLEMQAKIAAQLQAMREYLNWPDFAPNRRVHTMEALYSQPKNGRNCLGLQPLQFTPTTMEPSVSYKAIIDHLDHPFVRAFVTYVETRDAWATRYRTAEDGKAGGFSRAIFADGWLHPKWNPAGQKGTRFSSSPNVQNVPAKERDMFEAPPGYVFLGADKDQLELRILACNAGVRELVVEMAKPDSDPHSLAAFNIYGEEFAKRSAKERKGLRDMVKNTVYASIYNAGPTTVHKTLRVKKELNTVMRAALTIEVVTHIHRSYFGRYVEIPAHHEKNYQMAMRVGYNECNPLKRRRYYPTQPPPFTEVGNWETQTEGGEHVGREMVHIQDDWDRHPDWDAHICKHGHDAFYALCKAQYAEEAQAVAQHHFGDTVIEGPAGVVHLTAKVKIGKTMLAVK